MAAALPSPAGTTWRFTGDVQTYLGAAGGFLRARPAENTIVLTAAEEVRSTGPGAFGGSAPLFGWHAEPDGTVTAAFLHTPPFPVVLTQMTDRRAAALATALAGAGHQVPGVNAAPAPGAAFAAAWQQHTGQAARTGMRMRLYALGQLRPPDPAPPGRARTASAADAALMLAWLNAFHDEAGPEGPNASERVVRDSLGYGGLVLWEHEDRPVSLAGRSRAVAGQARIGPVYTPPELRGRGFGGAATAAVTQAALDDGADGVVLFTDLANPASNTLYQRLGYRSLGDWTVLRFAAAGD
jgi:RimJ/RimL family protein N-acetyltransferase